MRDIYYIVHLKENIDYSFNTTTCSNKFCGKLLGKKDDNLYFELNYSKALVIIPHKWIKWMAPSKFFWERDRHERLS